MNKTINELEALTELASGDELIAFDISEGKSKKITNQNLLKTVTPVNSVTSGDMHPVTSNAVARNNIHAIKDHWSEDINNPIDVLSTIESYADLISVMSEDIQIRIGTFATNSPFGVSVQTCDIFYTIKKINVSNNNWIRVIAYDIRSNQMWENAKINGTWDTWKKMTDSTVAQVSVTPNVTYITDYGTGAWVNCRKNGKLVTVNVEVANGSVSLPANTACFIATGLPIPANTLVNGNIFIDNINIYKRVWVNAVGELTVLVGADYTGNLFATVTYIES